MVIINNNNVFFLDVESRVSAVSLDTVWSAMVTEVSKTDGSTSGRQAIGPFSSSHRAYKRGFDFILERSQYGSDLPGDVGECH